VRDRRAAAVLLLAFAAIAAKSACRDASERAGDRDRRSRTERRIDEQLAPSSEIEQREGLAAAILIDVSGSMEEEVRGASGREEEKISIARRAARDLVEQFARYADEHPGEPVLLGLFEFSERSGQPDCRAVIPMGPPDRARAERALASMRAQGGTPIGNAMITAKRELDATGLTRRHLLVVTDGENTDGFAPDDVTTMINRRPEVERPSIYFVAFDIEERRFARVRDAGALLLGAADARELNSTLDMLLRGQIFVEK
jgi:Mg-chelatase subunit ChlD